jgi:hypothetical protein
MLMPKASVDKDHFLHRWKDKVGRSWQISAVQAEAVTHPVREASHDEFGARVRFPDAAHLCTDLFPATISHG